MGCQRGGGGGIAHFARPPLVTWDSSSDDVLLDAPSVTSLSSLPSSPPLSSPLPPRQFCVSHLSRPQFSCLCGYL